MNIVPTSPLASTDAGLDDAQWQRANNEGWPERDSAEWAALPGAVAPVIALAVESNVVDMHAWRMVRRPMQRMSTGGSARRRERRVVRSLAGRRDIRLRARSRNFRSLSRHRPAPRGILSVHRLASNDPGGTHRPASSPLGQRASTGSTGFGLIGHTPASGVTP